MTGYWDGTGITAEQVEAEVRRLALERPGYAYSPSNFPDSGWGSSCKYTHTLGDGEECPGCIIGVAIFNLTGRLVDQRRHGVAVANLPFMADHYNSRVGAFLRSVQNLQDGGETWGNAVRSAATAKFPVGRRMPQAPHTDEGVIKDVEWLGYTALGNPRFRVHLDNGNIYTTKSNSSVAQDLNNGMYRSTTVRLLLTKAQRIWDISVI